MNLSYRLGVRLQRLLLPSQRLKKTIHRPYSPRLLFELLTLIFIVGAFAGYACLASAQLAVTNGGSGSGVDTFSGARVFYTSKATVSLVVPADSVRRTEGVISQTKITAENGGTPRSEVAQRQVKISKAQATAVPFRICFVSVFTTPSVEVQRGTSTSALVLDSNGCYIDELSANTKLSEIYYIYGKHDTTDDRSELVIIHLDNETNRARPKTVDPFYVRDRVTIRDDDPTMVSLARVDNGPIVEGKPYPEGEAEFTVTLSRRLFSGETIDVPFEIGIVKSFSEARMLLKTGGSINQGVSLKSRRSLNPVINFLGDDESVVQTANVIVRAFNDRRVEKSDSVSIKLGPNDSSSTGFDHPNRETAVGGGAQSATTETFTVQIKDQPGEIPVTLSVNQNGTITEGDSALITATLGSVNASNQPVLIPIQVRAAQTTATTLDYQMPALISIAPGQMTGSVIFATTDNSTDTADKQVVVELGALSAPHSAGTPDHVSISIQDDEATTVTLAASTSQISETGSNNKTDVTISLSRALKSGESLTVPLTVTGATVQTHYELDLKSAGTALNQGVSINTNSPHSTQHPAIEFTGHATDVVDSATLELVAVHASDQLVRSVAIAFGSGTRAPNGSGINDALELAGSPQSVQIIDVDSGAPEVSVVRKHSHRHRESQNVIFTLTLSQVQAAATVVNVNVTQQGSYLKSGQQGVRQVTVPYGQTEVDFVVGIDDDNSDEANGEITASIEDGSGYSISMTGTSARVEVADDDGMPTVSIDLVPDDEVIDNADGSSQVTESGTSSSPGAINFRVTANPATLSPVTVKVNVTATGTVFQSGITGQRLVEIPANTSSANFIVGLENDATDELQGTVSVAIEADDTAYLVASAPDDAKTVIVLDDDPTAVVLTTTSDNTLTEGNPEDSANVYISLSRKLNVGETVTVPLQLTSTTGVALPGAANSEIELMVAGYGVTASATNSATPSIRFTGHSTKTVQTATMTVMPTSRTDNDTSEDTIVVSLGTPTATGLDDIRPSAVGTSHSSRVILQVNDQTESPAAGVVFSHPSVTLTPGASTAYQVWLQSDPEAEVVITVVSDHSEVRVDTDSTAAGDQNTLTFNASNWSTPQTVQLHIDSGSDSGGTSTFVWHRSTVATDSNHRYHNISIDEVSVQINEVDDDDYRVSLSVDNSMLFEGVQVRTISAVLDRPNNTGSPLSIPLRLGAGSTATATDYTLKVATIQIPNNASRGQTTFAANRDDLDEQDEIAIIEIHQLPVGVVPGSTATVKMSIFDNTPTTVSLTVPDDSTTTGDLAASAEIRLTLNRPLVGEESLTVPLLFTGAEPGEDFTLALNGNPNGVTFDAVAPSLTFSGPSNGVGASEVSILLNALAGNHRNDRKVNVSIPAESFDNGQNLVAINLSGGAIGARTGTGDITLFAQPKSSDPVVRIESTATGAVIEGATATFTASVDTSPAEDLTILLNVSGSYLTSGFASHHQIILKAGQTHADFNVPVLADTVDKPNGEIRVQVRDNPGVYAVHASLGSAVVTVFDDDATFVSIRTTGDELVEGGSQKLTIQLSRGLVNGERLEVPLQFMGSAVRNSDFTLSGQTPANRGVTYANLNRSGNNADSIAKVIFTGPAIGQSAQFAELTLTAVADGQTEGSESVSVVIFLIDESSNFPPSWDGLGGGVQASQTVHSLTISDVDDDDYRVSLSVDNSMLFEGVQVRTISAVLDRPNNTGSPLSIPLRLGAGSTATATDYTLKVATIQIPNNASRGQTTFAANRDDLDEQDEIAIIEIHQLPVGVVPGSTATVKMSIFDNTPTTVSLTVPDDSTTTGDLAASAEIRLTLNRPLVGEESLTVPLLFTGAEPGEDFTLALNGNPNGVTFDAVAPSLTFSGPSNGVGASEVSILLNALAGNHRNDRKVNVSIPAESFDNGQNLVAINLSGGAIGARTGTGDITLFAQPKSSDPVVRIESTATGAVIEGATATFTASVDTSPAEDLTILLNVSGSYLTSGFASHHQIILKAGQTHADFNVPVLADTVDKPNGEIRVQVRDNPGVYAVHASLGSAVVTVFDDDATFVSIRTTGDELVEGGSQKLTIQLSRGLVNGERLEVPLQFMGSAVRNSDFTLSGQTPANRGVTYANLNRSGNNADSIAKVIFTGPAIGQSAQFAELTLTAVADGQTEGSESVSVVIFLIDESSNFPPSWDGLGGGVQASQTVHSLTISDVDDDDYRVSLSVDNSMLFEGVQVRTISAVLDRPNNTGSPLSIPLRLGAGSTATATDYTLKVATIQIPNNASRGQTTFAANRDDLDEQDEIAIIEIHQLPVGVVPGSTATVKMSIFDNTPTTVSLTVPDDSTTTGDLAASAEIRLTLNRPLVGEESLTVPLLFTGAEPGEDFTLALNGNPNGVTFDAVAPSLTFSGPSNGVGASEVSILLNALAGNHRNDRKVNVSIPAESFDNGQNLVAINLSGGAIGARTGTGDITLFAQPKSSDPVVRIESTATGAVIEGATATFTASVDTSPAEDLTILLNVSGSYLTSGFASHHQIILKAGQTHADFNVPVLADTVDKPNGEIRVQVRDNPGVYAVHASLGSAVVTVFDDDATFVSIRTTGDELVEGGSQKLTIQLSRGLVNGERLEVPLQFMGSAVRNSDFTLSGQTPANRGVTYANLNRSGNNADSIAKVIFTGPAIGQSAQFAELTLTAVTDGQTEGSESVSVVIFLIDESSNFPPSWDGLGGGAQASQTVHSLTISDADVDVNAVNLTVYGASTHLIIEDEGSVAIAATLDSVNLSNSIVNIPISVNAPTSSADHNDYQVAAIIPIAPGEFFGTGVFQVMDDSEDEPIEDVTIEMGSALPDGIVPGTGQAVRIGIVDNDPTIVSLVRTDSGAIGEGGVGSLQQAEFNVSLGRSLAAGEVVHVPLDITGDAITENDITLSLASGADRNHGVALELISPLASVVTFVGQDSEVVQVANLVLTALPDDVEEADEALTVSLGFDGTTERVNSWAVRANVSDGGVMSHGRENQFKVVIQSQVESYVKVPELAHIVEDESGPGSIELMGDPRIDTSVTVRYASGTAVGASSCDSGVDYISDSVEFGLRAGVDVKRVPILTRCADAQDEHDETYTLQWDARAPVFDASAPNCRSATVCSTKVVIVDDDATRVDVTIPDRTAREGDPTQTAQILLTLSRSLITDEKLFVPLIFSENASAENFTLTLKDNPQGVSLDEQNRVVTFSGSDNSPSALAATIVLTALEDDNITNAIISVSIPRIAVDFHHKTRGMALADRSSQYIVGGDIIIEDQGRQTPPVASFKGTAVEVIESTGELSVDVVVDSVVETDLELIYRVSGTATPNEDYFIEGLNEQVGRVTIAQGRSGASIRVAINDDGVDEAHETLVLTLYASSGYMVDDFAQHTTMIVDNDEPIEPVINISGRNEIEEGQSSIFDLQADVEAPVDLQINLEVTQTGDFVSAGELGRSTVTILAGQRSATFEVATVDDAAFETPGAVTVSIDAGPGYRVGTTNVATVGVQDNDTVISRELARLWLTRFGRAVTGEIVESIGARIGNDDRSTGLNAKLAGTPIGADATPAHPEISEYSDPSGVQYRARSGFYQSLAELRDPTASTESGLQALTEDMFLTASEFTLTGETDRGETKGFWGRGFFLDLDGQSGALSTEGEIKGIAIGHDVTGAHAGKEYVAGALLSYASGSGQFTEANDSGKIESTLQSFVPYGSMEVREGLDIWAAVGVGTGELTVRRDHEIADSTDIDWKLLAGGFDQTLQPIEKFGLTLYGDYSRTWTTSKASSMGYGSNNQTSRSRVGLKLTTERTTSKQATIQLTGKLALRQDSGDAETGEGVEAGGEFAYVDPRGYNVKVQGRVLVAHSDSQIREQGLSVALQYDPEPETLRGFSGQLGLGTGSSTNSHALFGNEVMSGTSSGSTGEPGWNADIAYGVAYRQGLAASPYATLSGTDTIEQGQFGVRISKDKSFAPDLKIDVFVTAKKPDTGSGAGTDVGAGFSLVRHW